MHTVTGSLDRSAAARTASEGRAREAGGAAPTGVDAPSDAGTADAIRRYQAGDTDAILPVWHEAVARAQRDARAERARSSRSAPLDDSDLESSLAEAFYGAVGTYDPGRGVPFWAFFAPYRKAAILGERAALGAPVRLSRRAFHERAKVLDAAAALREPTRAEGATPYRVNRRAVFTLSPRVTDAFLSELASADDARRAAPLLRVLRETELFLRRAIRGFPVADAKALAVDRLREALKGPQPPTRTTLGATLQARLGAFLARAARDGVVAPLTAGAQVGRDWATAVAARAGVTVETADAILGLDVAGVSLDAPVAGKDGTNAGTVGEHLAVEVHRDTGDLIRARLLKAMPMIPVGSRTLLVRTLGLDGGRRWTQDALAAAMGMLESEVEAGLEAARIALTSPAVRAYLREEDEVMTADAVRSDWLARISEAFIAGAPAIDAPPVVEVSVASPMGTTVGTQLGLGF